MILKDQESNIVKRFLRGFLLQELCSESSLPYQEEHGECFLQKKGFKGLMEMCPWLLGDRVVRESCLEIIKDQRI